MEEDPERQRKGKKELAVELPEKTRLRQLSRASPLRKGKSETGHYSLLGGDEKGFAEPEQAETPSHSGPEKTEALSGLPSPEDTHPSTEPVQAELFSPQLQEPTQSQHPEPMDDSQAQSCTRAMEIVSTESERAPTGSHSSDQSTYDPDWRTTAFKMLGKKYPEHLNEPKTRTSIPAKERALIDPHASQMQPRIAVQEEEIDFSEQNHLYFGDIDNLRTAEDGICTNIHILGTGNIGKFIAHSLAGMTKGPKVTLLLHRPLRIQEWYDEGQGITLYSKQVPDTRTSFEVESASSIDFSPDRSYPAYGPNLETSIVPPTSIIDHLIVTTKATATISALESVKARLRPTSTVCFIHNGMGVREKINEVFPNPVTRPNIVFGTISHGVGSVAERKFSCTYNGHGVLDICSIDRYYNEVLRPEYRIRSRELIVERKNVGYPPSVRWLMRTLTRCTELKASGHSYNKFILIQLEKLAVNAVINPLTVIYDCKNAELLHNEHITSTIQSLLREISAVILELPELEGKKMSVTTNRKALERRFSPENLYALIVGIAQKTGWNHNSTLQDVRKGVPTEIEFINGYIVQRGREVGVGTPVNQFVLDAVKGKQRNVKKVIDGYIPWKRTPKL